MILTASLLGMLAAALLSPGWGALLAGTLAYALELPLMPSVLAAAAGGLLGDLLFTRLSCLMRMPADRSWRMRLMIRLEGVSSLAGIGLQSIHLFRRDWMRHVALRGTIRPRHLALSAVGSLIGALVGATVASSCLSLHFGAWGPEAARPILPGLALLALPVAETWRIVVERLVQRHYDCSSS